MQKKVSRFRYCKVSKHLTDLYTWAILHKMVPNNFGKAQICCTIVVEIDKGIIVVLERTDVVGTVQK